MTSASDKRQPISKKAAGASRPSQPGKISLREGKFKIEQLNQQSEGLF
jgi:hypothetical protein